MAKTKKQETALPVTRAEKKDAVKKLIKDILGKKTYKHNDLIDAAAKLYAEKFSGEDTENVNDVKGRVGSVLDIMKKEGEVSYDGGVYALKMQNIATETQEKAQKKTKTARGKAKAETPATVAVEEEVVSEKTTEKPKKKATKKSNETDELKKQAVAQAPKKKTVKKTAEEKAEKTDTKKKDEEYQPIPPAPLQPIAPVAPITPEVAPEPIPDKKDQEKLVKKAAAKKRGTKASESKKEAQGEVKTEKPTVEPIQATPPLSEEKESKQEGTVLTKIEDATQSLVVKEKAEIVKKDVVDMSFLFGGVKAKQEKEPLKTDVKPIKTEAQQPIKTEMEQKPVTKLSAEQKPAQKEQIKAETAVENKKPNVRKLPQKEGRALLRKVSQKPMTAEEKLRENFLKRLRYLGGEYFEYYSVYLLERYSMKNGRRLEGMKISGGGHDGGIDGEIELTDRFGFKETIYIQSKNWDPDKGDEKLWVVGETLLQQFIGACVCRQAKDGKQNARGIFVTTSRFTPEAKHILEDMSDKIVGYDGVDVFEAAKECQFGLVYENGNWKLDEKLLSGEKAFFNMF